jgi:aryl-alcohol dehydrogenase-like predicted oxidoreductase
MIEAIRQALEAGINFFDTADVYGFGRSEELLGHVLAGREEDVVVATKCGVTWDESGNIGRDASPAYVRKALDASLKRLKMESIPLYQVHWPDPCTPVSETIAALKECQREGKIGEIGCSNFSADELREACVHGGVASLQSAYSLIDRDVEGDILTACRELGLGFIAYGPLARGLLSGKYKAGSRFSEDDSRNRDDNFRGESFARNLQLVEELEAVAESYHRTPAQVAIKWVLENKGVDSALTGIKNPAQLMENIGALGWNLSPEDHVNLTASSGRILKGGSIG